MHSSARISVFFVLLAAASPSYAICRMPPNFTLTQENGPIVKLTTVPNGDRTFGGVAKTGGGYGAITEGRISDNGRLKFKIDWGGSLGVYTGVVEDGIVQDGRTYDAANTESWSIWTSNTRINCN
jgi:hypothetical protein